MDVGIETEWEELPDDPRDEAETMHVSEDAPTTLEMKLRVRSPAPPPHAGSGI